MQDSICVFISYAKEKHEKNKKKFDKRYFLYIICRSATQKSMGM